VLGLVNFHFLLSILCVLLILSRLKATISVFFVPCCPVLLSFYLILSYMFELNKWRWSSAYRNILHLLSIFIFLYAIQKIQLLSSTSFYRHDNNYVTTIHPLNSTRTVFNVVKIISLTTW